MEKAAQPAQETDHRQEGDPSLGLYSTLPTALLERANCGTGFIAHLSARPSNSILQQALVTLNRLAHRGAIAADAKTGDGAGVLTQIPEALFARELGRRGLPALAAGNLAVGVFFLPREDMAARVQAKQIVESTLIEHNLPLLTWRAVPIDLDALGNHARKTAPHIEQALVARPPHATAGEQFERRLLLARKEIERRGRVAEITPLYIPSLSSRTIVYKGLLVSPALANFYADLRDPAYETALALFHQRYSTNTFPNWERAQPFRFLCHNGEINTLQGNVAWMHAREPFLASPVWEAGGKQAPALLRPVVDTDGSDSAMLDNVLELLALSGRDLVHAQLMLMPAAWEKVADIPTSWKAFYRYHSSLMEPWDGPAAIAYSDGRVAGMALDRNGLRPARYLVTDDGLVVAASEAGVAKAFADVVQISGHSGGTGASPLSSMKHAGIAWELGLAETQQVLVANDLRGRVRIRVDGGFKTARHVIVAALLGADEFSFGTAVMVAAGCIMARACHSNTCPTGIATQREDLRRKFSNDPGRIVAYFNFVAEEAREYMAALGFRTFDEMIGRVDRLKFSPRAKGTRGAFANALPPSDARWDVVNSALTVN